MPAVAGILRSGNLGPVHPIGVRHAANVLFDTHDADTSALVAAQNMEVRRVLADRERYVAPA